jgi:Ni/Co efflux regulator RcnB
MMRKTLSAFALVATIGATALIPATASSQDHDRSEHRVFDRDHRDYHNWNKDEDRRYRNYLAEQHRRYRAYARLNKKQQSEYWKWRHDHDGR